MTKYLIKKLIVLVFLCGAFSFSGCVSTGAQFTKPDTPPVNQSIVYFYRGKSLMANTTLPGVNHNGTEVLTRLPHQSFWKYHIIPGIHKFEPEQFGLYKKETLTLKNDRPGQVYYVEMVVEFGYIGLKLRTESQGIAGIAPCYEVLSDGMAGENSGTNSSAASAEPAKMYESEGAAGAIPVKQTASGPAVLHVNAVPEMSRIRIMNIKPKFHQGIELAPGKYLIEVSAKGYATQSKWIALAKGEVRKLSVTLVPIAASSASVKAEKME